MSRQPRPLNTPLNSVSFTFPTLFLVNMIDNGLNSRPAAPYSQNDLPESPKQVVMSADSGQSTPTPPRHDVYCEQARCCACATWTGPAWYRYQIVGTGTKTDQKLTLSLLSPSVVEWFALTNYESPRPGSDPRSGR